MADLSRTADCGPRNGKAIQVYTENMRRCCNTEDSEVDSSDNITRPDLDSEVCATQTLTQSNDMLKRIKDTNF